ncbi:MAG: YhcH/YjgK/YiaL family protein [Candidatus Omnitrophica bacterium]|nr:YhcH/YjgK/YiaL family protein [Candidatus Omnitrophota bacterium]
MILDEAGRFSSYLSVHPLFGKVAEFLSGEGPVFLEEGRHKIHGDDIFVIIARSEGVGKEKARLEAHRKYIDIQMPLEGEDVIGWSPITSVKEGVQAYDEKKDIEFFTGAPETWIDLKTGKFAVFFPFDCHAPLAGGGNVLKAVIKVAV